jgi:hypothetical protein
MSATMLVEEGDLEGDLPMRSAPAPWHERARQRFGSHLAERVVPSQAIGRREVHHPVAASLKNLPEDIVKQRDRAGSRSASRSRGLPRNASGRFDAKRSDMPDA